MFNSKLHTFIVANWMHRSHWYIQMMLA